MTPILIIDYGMGNIGSLRNMFRRIGVETDLCADPEPDRAARGNCFCRASARSMRRWRGSTRPAWAMSSAGGHSKDGVPTLGVCLGMQLLTDGSEEGSLPGLGIDPGPRPPLSGLRQAQSAPHGMEPGEKTGSSPLTAPLPDDSRFYFVHGYYVAVEDQRNSILKTTYGVRFDAAIQSGNVFGAQFHPEKSHRFGMTLLKAFADLPC